MDLRAFQQGMEMALNGANIKDARKRAELMEAAQRQAMGNQTDFSAMMGGPQGKKNYPEMSQFMQYMTPQAAASLMAQRNNQASRGKSQAKTRDIVLPDGTPGKQEFDYDPVTGDRTDIGEPYPVPTGNIFMGTNEEGRPLFGSTRGPINVREARTPGGSAVLPKNKKVIPAATIKELGRFKDLHSTINEITLDFDENLVGPIDAIIGKVGSKFISMPQFASFRHKVGRLRTLVYAESGKQINTTELEWLKQDILPQLENPGPNFMATLNSLDEWLIRREGMERQDLSDAGYYVPKKKSGGKINTAADFLKKKAGN